MKKLRDKLTRRGHKKSVSKLPENVAGSSATQSPSQGDDASITKPIIDVELEEDVKEMMKQCGTHTATISVRRQREEQLIDQQTRTITSSEDFTHRQVTAERHKCYHIASITKLLIATALIVAAKGKHGQMDEDKRKRLERFKHIEEASLAKLYNGYIEKSGQDRKERIGPFHKKSTIVDLLRQNNGFYSTNHRMFNPVGESIMALNSVPMELLQFYKAGASREHTTSDWLGYSNLNYSAIALAIEAMWENNLESFMKEVLFDPLGMGFTRIGIPVDDTTMDTIWVVDSMGETHSVHRHPYRSNGAEAAALGAYSTAHDLDNFFKFIMNTLHGESKIPGFDASALKLLIRDYFDAGGGLKFTAFGLLTTLSSSNIGILSINRAQFPDEAFTRYTVQPEREANEIDVFYMTGSANGCSCVTAVHLGGISFSVTVLTNTSGPVDAADHISRLVLQRMASWVNEQRASSDTLAHPPSQSSVNIVEMVKQNRARALEEWKTTETRHGKELQQAPQVSKNLEGTYKGDGFGQQLVIGKKEDKNFSIAIDGPASLTHGTEFDLCWIDDSSVKIFVPLHLSIDCLGHGDWANLLFQVEDESGNVVALLRKTSSGIDKFLKTNL